jgi:hypothetical protein
MIVKGLDGKEYKWSTYKYHSGNDNKTSKLHKQCREVLKDVFPLDRILEEVYLPGTGTLYADFYIPSKNLIIEVHGIQHYEYNTFFFKTKMEFYRAQGRDRKKIEWCNLNDIDITVLDGRKKNEWDSIIRGQT